jgi:hypothetical protein
MGKEEKIRQAAEELKVLEYIGWLTTFAPERQLDKTNLMFMIRKSQGPVPLGFDLEGTLERLQTKNLVNKDTSHTPSKLSLTDKGRIAYDIVMGEYRRYFED